MIFDSILAKAVQILMKERLLNFAVIVILWLIIVFFSVG